MQKIIQGVFVFLSVFTHVSAQQIVPCVTDQLYQQSSTINPALKIAENRANEMARAQTSALLLNKKTAIMYIPVVFHIIHNNGLENISQAQIMDALRVMNEDYRKKAGTNGGSSTNALATDMMIEFRLAQFDASGNKSDGIDRVQNTATMSADDGIKNLSYWDSNKYMNVWIVNTIKSQSGVNGTILGYSAFPWVRPSQPLLDGIIVRYDQVGTIGSVMASQAGRTLTHESGHWLGLYHPFQPDIHGSDGCSGGMAITSSTCNSTGDYVCDTPPVATPTSGCPTSQNSCTNDSPDLPDLVQDYMDYADGTCQNLFTAGQKTRVYSMSFTGQSSNSNRVNAASLSNLNSAGIDGSTGNYLPVAAASKKAEYVYDFENSSLANDGWKLNNFNNAANGWQIVSGISKSGGSCIEMRNFLNTAASVNSRDGFQSPEIDLTTVTSPYLSFFYAYAQRAGSTTDALNVTISNDFGMSETNLFSRTGGNTTADLATAAPQSSEYIPASGDWRLVSVNLAPYKTFTHSRFRFEFVNHKGNNVFVDNFKITNGPVQGINEAMKDKFEFSFKPNPMPESATVHFKLNDTHQIKIVLTDITGREVISVADGRFDVGDHDLTVNRTNLHPGIYFLRFLSESETFTYKILMN